MKVLEAVSSSMLTDETPASKLKIYVLTLRATAVETVPWYQITAKVLTFLIETKH